MKSSLLLLSGASVALAAPVLDVIVETDIVYYTVTQEYTVVQTAAAENHVDANIHLAATTPAKVISTTSTALPVVTVTIDADEIVQKPSPPPATSVKIDAAAPAKPASPALPTDFASTAVYHHNIHRANHSAPAMAWGSSYAGFAATVAASCKFAHDLTPGGGGYGQNIAMYASTDASSLKKETIIAQAITEMWYNNELNIFPSNAYGQANPDFSDFELWGHYSQIVWGGSTVLGCAAQYCEPGRMTPGMGAWYSVCNYYPAGNMNGAYGKNVLPPQKQASVHVNIAA